VSEHDREQLSGWAQSLRQELAQINPAFPWNRQRIADRTAELARIEAKLSRESELHAAFIARRAELVARFYVAPRWASPANPGNDAGLGLFLAIQAPERSLTAKKGTNVYYRVFPP
jgi:hypothetical protein